MKRLNRLLAALAVAVLMVVLSLLGWLRQRAVSEQEAAVRHAADSFKKHEILRGPVMISFEQAERLAARAMENPYINKAYVSKLTENGEEIPIVPFPLRVEMGRDWQKKLLEKNWRRVPLTAESEIPFGYLYLDMDRSALRSMNWAIGALGIAIALMLLTLLARVWSQETSLTRTMVELNERRRELIRLERLALAGQLSASLLHDLRKPVLHIKNNLDDLSEALGDFALAAPALEDLHRQTKLFFQMLTDTQIERFVQSDRAGEEYLDMAPMLDLSLNLVRYERRGVEVIRRENDGLPPVLAQPYRIIQLFSNLILNAFQAMNGRGQLVIEAARARGGIEVRLTDNGPGIAAGVLDHIFDPFFTTKPIGEGTGLGLSICRMIVDDLGGKITAESREGGPTTFKVWLHASDESEN